MNPAPEGSSQSPYPHEAYVGSSYMQSGSRSLANEEVESYDSEYTESTQHAGVPNDSTSSASSYYAPVENLAQDFGGLSMSSEPYVSYGSLRYTPSTMNTYEQNEGAYNSTGQSTYRTFTAGLDGGAYFCTLATCPLKFDSIRERDRHFTTMHSNNGERPYRCLVHGCEARVTSWARPERLKDHNKNWHGPYACTVSSCSRGRHHGFRSQHDLNLHTSETHGFVEGRTTAPEPDISPQPYPAAGPLSTTQTYTLPDSGSMMPQSYSSSQPYPAAGPLTTTQSYGSNDDGSPASGPSNYYQPYSISGSQSTSIIPPKALPEVGQGLSNSSSHRKSKGLDPRFKVYHSKDFRLFRVFKVLWSEPAGATTTISASDITEDEIETSKLGQKVHQKIRRFVIVRTYIGHSQCLPILTYHHQGTTKFGVHKGDHAVIFSGRHKPLLLPGEQELDFEPIQIIPATPRDHLDPASRVNYAKMYTIEHNVKVCFIGEVSNSSQRRLMISFDEVSSRGGPVEGYLTP